MVFKYSSLHVLIAVSIITIGHAAEVDPYDKHLLRPDNSEYAYGRGRQQFTQLMANTEIPRIASVLDHGSRAIVFHGMMGSGKSSVIERLSNNSTLSISSGRNFHRQQQQAGEVAHIGHTWYTTAYPVIINHENNFILLDTPGFGEVNDAARLKVINSAADVVKYLEDNQVPLFGIYFLVDPTQREASIRIVQNLELVKFVYGEAAAARTRLVVNKSDQLAGEGQEYIEGEFTQELQRIFNSVFQVDCENIIFICADLASHTCCLGQLIDDIVDEDPHRVLNVANTAADQVRHINAEIQDLTDNILPPLQEAITIIEANLQTSNRDLYAAETQLRDFALPWLEPALDDLNKKTRMLEQAENEVKDVGFLDLSGCYMDWTTDQIMQHVIALLKQISERNLWQELWKVGGVKELMGFTMGFEDNFYRIYGYYILGIQYSQYLTIADDRFNPPYGMCIDEWTKMAEHYQRHEPKQKQVKEIQAQVQRCQESVDERQEVVNRLNTSISTLRETINNLQSDLTGAQSTYNSQSLNLVERQNSKSRIVRMAG